MVLSTRKIVGSTSLWLVFNPLLAMAQTASGPATGQLEEVVVSAQRRDENLQQVPLAVSVLSASQLQSAGIAGSADIKLAVASADVPVINGYALPFIRGIGSKAPGPTTESSVSTYVDNVYIGNQSSALLQFNDIARVEVLKGPQGTLFGRNATGGLISIVTRDPTDRLEGSIHAGYANYETARGDLYISGPISSGIKADLAAYVTHQGEGYGTNLFNGKDIGRTNYDWGVRSKWLLGTGPFTVRLTADYSSMKTSAFVQRVAFGASAPPPYGPVIVGGSPWDTNLNVVPSLKSRGGGLSAKADYEFGSGITLTSITAWRKNTYHNHFDADVTATDGREIDALQLDSQFSQELQLLSASTSPITWVTGAFLWDAHGRYNPSGLIADGPARVGPFTGVGYSATYAKQDVLSLAPYAQATAEVFDATKLTLGVRFTYERRIQNGAQTNFAPSGTQVGPTVTINQRLTANKPTWRVAVDHEFGSDVLGYVSYNRGFKSGGANLTSVTAPFYGPEKLDAYEAGLKSTLLDHRMRLNAATFYYDYTGIQVTSANAGIISTYNGAAARTYGFEFELDAQVTSQLRLNGGYTYLNAKFTDFPAALTNLANPAGGVRQVFTSAKGNQLPNSPHSVLTLGATYAIPIGSNTLTFNGSMYYNSGYFGEPDNFRRQPSYELYNASVELTFQDRWTLSVWGKNLSNAAVDNFPSVNGIGGGLGVPRSSYAPPRTFGATVGVEF